MPIVSPHVASPMQVSGDRPSSVSPNATTSSWWLVLLTGSLTVPAPTRVGWSKSSGGA